VSCRNTSFDAIRIGPHRHYAVLCRVANGGGSP
jgi:hypothetical protein